MMESGEVTETATDTRLDRALRPEHRRWADPIRDQIAGIYHWRAFDRYRLGRLMARNDAFVECPQTLHVAAVVLTDGRCYMASCRRSGTPYVRKHWYTAAVGRALKRAVLNNWGPFMVDVELDRRAQFEAIRAAWGLAR